MSGWAACRMVAVLAALAAPAVAGDTPPPTLTHARLQTRSAASGLREAVRGVMAAGAGPAWIAYEVPTESGQSMCCWDSVASIEHTRAPGCRLEGRGAFTMGDAGGPARLEDDRSALVFLRASGGRVGRARTLSWRCGVDAGGLPVYWLSGVVPAQSAELLASLLREDTTTRHLLDELLMALSIHAEPAALDRLVEAARRHESSRVRAQSLFWLSQKAGRRAVETISDAVSEDPESRVREQAVFALSQLPREEGVPKLIELARSHRDPRVRKRAMFWLGQSEDPRALALFEQILKQ